jgi:hypothetical protein
MVFTAPWEEIWLKFWFDDYDHLCLSGYFGFLWFSACFVFTVSSEQICEVFLSLFSRLHNIKICQNKGCLKQQNNEQTYAHISMRMCARTHTLTYTHLSAHVARILNNYI